MRKIVYDQRNLVLYYGIVALFGSFSYQVLQDRVVECDNKSICDMSGPAWLTISLLVSLFVQCSLGIFLAFKVIFVKSTSMYWLFPTIWFRTAVLYVYTKNIFLVDFNGLKVDSSMYFGEINCYGKSCFWIDNCIWIFLHLFLQSVLAYTGDLSEIKTKILAFLTFLTNKPEKNLSYHVYIIYQRETKEKNLQELEKIITQK